MNVLMETDFNIEHQDNVTESNNVILNTVNSVDNIGEETIETSNYNLKLHLQTFHQRLLQLETIFEKHY